MTKPVSMLIGAVLLVVSCGERKFIVPKEPAVAGKLLLAETASEEDAPNEQRYLGYHILYDPEMIAMGWDMVRTGDKKVDYITVRRFKVVHAQESGESKIIIEKFPVLYYVDFDNNADGNAERMYGFVDEDADGDPRNAKLVQDPRKERSQ